AAPRRPRPLLIRYYRGMSDSSAVQDSMLGESVGNYRIVSRLGAGGVGVVYLAEHPQMGKQAAVKMLLPEVSADRGILDRFFNEARATSLLQHPGIIEVFDLGLHASGRAYILMEFLHGESVAERIGREGIVAPATLLDIARQMARALAAAHAQNVIHRDL